MFDQLEEINSRPVPFGFYTAEALWTNEHTSEKILEYHLNESIDLSSRNRDFIVRSVNWIVSRFCVNSETSIADFGCGPGLYTTLLARFHTVLKPGGALLMDVHTLNIFNARTEVSVYEPNQLDGFWAPEKYYGFFEQSFLNQFF